MIAGNSLGGFTALYAAASEAATAGTGNACSHLIDTLTLIIYSAVWDRCLMIRLLAFCVVGLINGAILLNAAGRFKEFTAPEPEDTRAQW